MALQIRNRDDLRAWLETQPAQASALIASRIALRVFPLIDLVKPHDIAVLIVPTLRAILFSSLAAKYPTDKNRAAASAAASATKNTTATFSRAAPLTAAAGAAAYAAAFAAVAASAQPYASGLSAEAAVDAAEAGSEATFTVAFNVDQIKISPIKIPFLIGMQSRFWFEIERDCRVFEEKSPTHLFEYPIYENTEVIKYVITALIESLREINHYGNFWEEVFKTLIGGGVIAGLMKSGEKILLDQVISLPEEFWKDGKQASDMLDEMYREALEKARGRNEPDPDPEIPPQQPASVQPEWVDGRLTNVVALGPPNGDVRSLDAAILNLRDDLRELAESLDDNVDPRFRRRLSRHIETMPSVAPTDRDVLFRLGVFQSFLAEYVKTVDNEWNGTDAAFYRAVVLHYEGTLEKFPEWRAFKADPELEIQTNEDVEKAVAIGRAAVDAWREESNSEFIDHSIADALDIQIQELTQISNNELVDSVAPASLENRQIAKDILNSVNNTLKRVGEVVLRKLKSTAQVGSNIGNLFVEGVKEQIPKSAKEAGADLVKATAKTLTGAITWSIRLGVIAGAGVALNSTFPAKFGWLKSLADFILKNLSS